MRRSRVAAAVCASREIMTVAARVQRSSVTKRDCSDATKAEYRTQIWCERRRPVSRLAGHAARRDEQSVPVDGVLSGTFVPPRNRCCLLFACTGMS